MKKIDSPIVLKAAALAKLKKYILGVKDPYFPLPKGINLSPHNVIENQIKFVDPELSFNKFNHIKPKKWQENSRSKLEEILGYQNKRKIPKVIMELEEQKLEGSIYRKGFYLDVGSNLAIPISLIYQKDRKLKWPIYFHLAGSTSGFHLSWGAAKVPIDHQRLAHGADMALQAARKGYLAISMEQVCYGERMERKLPKKSKNRSVDFAGHLLLFGRTLLGFSATEVSSVLDWLFEAQDIFNIDKNRVFLFGHSLGGGLALYVSALDTRFSGLIASGCIGELSETDAKRGVEGSLSIVPQLLKYFETSDIICLLAPRPIVAINGVNDHIFPFSGSKKTIDLARPFYERFSSLDKIDAISGSSGHQYYPQESWSAMKNILDNKIPS